jgi:hypothetical protein
MFDGIKLVRALEQLFKPKSISYAIQAAFPTPSPLGTLKLSSGKRKSIPHCFIAQPN